MKTVELHDAVFRPLAGFVKSRTVRSSDVCGCGKRYLFVKTHDTGITLTNVESATLTRLRKLVPAGAVVTPKVLIASCSKCRESIKLATAHVSITVGTQPLSRVYELTPQSDDAPQAGATS